MIKQKKRREKFPSIRQSKEEKAIKMPSTKKNDHNLLPNENNPPIYVMLKI